MLSTKTDDKHPLKKEYHDYIMDSQSTYLGRWAELPSSALEKVYTYLDRSDQFNVSLVCKSWSQEYGSPCLWKTFSLDLFKKSPVIDVWPEVKFARRFGSMFKHIDIIGRPGLRKKKIIEAFLQMQLFFEAIKLSNCQLFSIKFQNMYDPHRFLSERVYSNFLQSVSNFMSSQHYLQTVEFHNCYYNKSNGISFPRIICESIANTLNTLVLKGKSRDGTIGNHLILEYGIVLQKLKNLKLLRTDYTANFEKILFNFCDEIGTPNQVTMALSSIELHCDGSEPSSVRGIPQESWQHLRNICPDLKVKLNLVYSDGIRNHLGLYFEKYIPLAHLEFRIEKALGFEIEDLLGHLCSCRATERLEYLSIVWMPTIQNISTYLSVFLQECTILKKLQLSISYPATGLEKLFESIRLIRQGSLESFNFFINATTEADRQFLSLLANKYAILLQIEGQAFEK